MGEDLLERLFLSATQEGGIFAGLLMGLYLAWRIGSAKKEAPEHRVADALSVLAKELREHRLTTTEMLARLDERVKRIEDEK